MDEIIVVVPREKLFGENDENKFQGIMKDVDLTANIVEVLDEYSVSMRRGDAEEDPAYKQVITYAVIAQGEKVFFYKRLLGGGESRLYGKKSIGVGGHMNAEEGHSFSQSLLENLQRELDEEIKITTDPVVLKNLIEAGVTDEVQTMLEVGVLGFLNDETDEAGVVHLGIVFVINLNEDTIVTVRETEQLEGEMILIEDLKKSEHYDSLENWSKIVLEAL